MAVHLGEGKYRSTVHPRLRQIPALNKRPNALQFLLVGLIALILATALVVTSGVLATWLDPEPETNSMYHLP